MLKYHKYTLPLLLIINLLVKFLYAQNYSKQNNKIESWEYYPLNDYRVVDYSIKNQLLMEKTNNDSVFYYLYDLNTRSENYQVDKLFALHEKVRHPLTRFSTTGEQIYFKRKENSKKIWEVYDIGSEKIKQIESKYGAVDRISIFDMDNILYRVNLPDERPNVYLVKGDQDPFYIDKGTSMIWSFDNNYFLVLTFKNPDLSLREKRDYGLISLGEYQRQYKARGGMKREIFRRFAIYNSKGKKLLTLEDFDLVDWIQWSPDNSKIVLHERNDPGFKIVYLNFVSENNVVIDSVYHFLGIPEKRKGLFAGCQTPTWSPDSKKILFMTEVDDGDNVLEMNTYILEDHKYDYFQVLDEDGNSAPMGNWISGKSIIFPNYKAKKMVKCTYNFK